MRIGSAINQDIINLEANFNGTYTFTDSTIKIDPFDYLYELYFENELGLFNAGSIEYKYKKDILGDKKMCENKLFRFIYDR